MVSYQPLSFGFNVNGVREIVFVVVGTKIGQRRVCELLLLFSTQ